MGGTVFAYGNTCVCRTDFHVEMGITDGIADLFKRPSRSEHRERADKRNQSRCRSTGGYTEHISFRNAAVEKSVRKCLFELDGFCRFCKVCVENDDIIF